MNALFQYILSLLLVYKYLALFFVTLSSSMGMPLPAGSSVIASAAFASQGYLNIIIVLIVGFTGNILGDMAMYTLSRRYGKRVLAWLHLKSLMTSELFKHAEEVEKNYSAPFIIISRFQDQATTIVNIFAGLGHMQFKRFVLYAVIGDILQILFYGSIGYFFAANWQSLYGTVGVFIWLIMLGAIVISILASSKITKKMLS